MTIEVHETDITHNNLPTLTWSCSPEYSKLWKMFHVHLCRISHRALYLLYHLCMRSAAFIAEKREQKCNYFSECWKTKEEKVKATRSHRNDSYSKQHRCAFHLIRSTPSLTTFFFWWHEFKDLFSTISLHLKISENWFHCPNGFRGDSFAGEINHKTP